MKKLSLVKTAAALLITNCYLFTCNVMGTVGGADMTDPAGIPDGTAEAGEPGSDLAGGQGTLDFLVPDETGRGYVELSLLNIAPTSLSDKAVQSTYGSVVVIENDPEEVTGENARATAEAPDEQETDELIITLPEETEELPEETPAATTATTPATTPATTKATTAATTPATTTTSAPVTTPATTATTTVFSGIPVDGDATAATTTAATTAPDDQPDATEPPEDEPDNTGGDASEILYVRSNGGVVSGTALDIVSRITQNEVGHTFAPEAIKAQAVAAYTYVRFCNDYGTYPSVILASSVSDSVQVLVKSVIGQGIYYNGSLIQAVYSASSAGYTASSKNVWGSDYPYLVSRFCDLDSRYDPNYGKTVQFSSEDIKSRVKSVTGIELSGDPSGWITIEERLDGNYVGQMSVGGYHSYTDSDGDNLKITGRRFREKIMSFDLRSSAFDVDYDSSTDMFTFTTYGYGHGVGMSQNGANALATYLGYDYKQILTYYYAGTEVR
ncbi:MAG: SpoIID/LytB domain-containing protein [Oscillospiraceae bacterium]